MDWGYLFSYAVMQRGRDIYRRNQVHSVQKIGEHSYKANVEEEREYDKEYETVVDITDTSSPKLSCSCPLGKAHYSCAHMAALLYAVTDENFSEDKLGQPEKKPKPIRTLKPGEIFKKNPDVYQYFDLEKAMSDIAVSETDILTARKVLDSNLINSVTYRTYKYGFYYESGYMLVTSGYIGEVNDANEISVEMNREEIYYAKCPVKNCHKTFHRGYGLTRLCCHQLALMIMLSEKMQTETVGDNTSLEAQRLLGIYKKPLLKTEKVQKTEKDEITLQPRFELYKDNGFKVSYKAGAKKLYSVKNFANLISAYKDKEEYKITPKNGIDFSNSDFDEESKKHYEIIRETYFETERQYEILSNEYDITKKPATSYLIVSGRLLDNLVGLMMGKEMEHIDDRGKSNTTMCQVTDGEFRPTVILRKVNEEGIFSGISIGTRCLQFVEGMDYIYYVKYDKLIRCDRKKAETILPLISYTRNNLPIIGRSHLGEFFRNLYPVITEQAELEGLDIEDIKEYLPLDVKFVFYLDFEKEDITCRAYAVYGEQRYSLSENGKIQQGGIGRDKETEKQVYDILRRIFPCFTEKNNAFSCGRDEEIMYNCIGTELEKLFALGEVNSTDRFKRLKIHNKLPVKVGVSVKSDLMNLTISSDEFSNEELLGLLSSYKKKKKYYRLKSGDFLNLDNAGVADLYDICSSLHVSDKDFLKDNIKVPLYRAIYLDTLLDENSDIYSERDRYFKNLIRDFKTVKESDYEVPDSLSKIMRKYQKYGFKWMRMLEKCHFGGILADDMGLGKTLQMISVILSAKERGEEGTSLVICPASLVYNWLEEIKKFSPALKCVTVTGSQKERSGILNESTKYDVLVTSYDLLKRDIAEYEGKKFLYEIIDEAQFIKNFNTAAAKSVKVISATYKYALTGTPIENRLSELWSIFDFLMPGFLYSYDSFRKEIELPISKEKDPETTARLKQMVSPFILRRLKGDVLKDLPEKLEEVRYARLGENQQKLYDAQVVHLKEMLENKSAEDYDRNKLQVLAELTKIRQICCDPSLLFEDYDGESAKRETFMTLIESAIEGEHKVLVFSQFTSMLAIMEEDLKNAGIKYYKLIGSTPKEQRQTMVHSFNEDDTPVFLISLKAGGTGLNLTGADVVIHYDPWWNIAAQNQATDRTHRIGQTKVVNVFKLIAKDTIEEKILMLQEEKKNLAEAILSGETGGIVNMSKEELLELFEV